MDASNPLKSLNINIDLQYKFPGNLRAIYGLGPIILLTGQSEVFKERFAPIKKR